MIMSLPHQPQNIIGLERLIDGVRDLIGVVKNAVPSPAHAETVSGLSEACRRDAGIARRFTARSHERPVYYDEV